MSTSTDAPVARKAAPTTLRARQAEDRRRRLFDAARMVVGESGYTETTISKITKRAGLAQGTFYNYFSSRQELFESLLPALGDELLAFLDHSVVGAESVVDMEERCLRAFFDFSREHPEFYRILTEAEVFVPRAHRLYICKLAEWYTRAFSERAAVGTLADYTEQEREVVAYILLAAHHYLTLRYTHWIGHEGRIPDWVISSYARFVSGAFGGSLAGAAAKAWEPGPADVDEQSSDDTPRTLRFVPQLVPRPYAESVAFAPQLDCRTNIREDGRVVVELDLHHGLLNSRGTVAGGLVTAFAELAGATAVCLDREEISSVASIALNTSLIRPVSEGTLVATARRENAGRNIRFVDIRITQDSEDGDLIARVSGTFRVLGD